MARAAIVRRNRVHLSFGRHHGLPLDQVPREYLLWAANQSRLPQLREIRDEVKRRRLRTLEINESVLNTVSKSTCWWSSGLGVADWVRSVVGPAEEKSGGACYSVFAGPFRLVVSRGPVASVVVRAEKRDG